MGRYYNAVPVKKIKAGENGFKADALVGCRSDSYGYGSYVWSLFNRKDVPQHLIDMHKDLGYALTQWEPYSKGIGKVFAGVPSCRISRNRILVIQYRGIDN